MKIKLELKVTDYKGTYTSMIEDDSDNYTLPDNEVLQVIFDKACMKLYERIEAAHKPKTTPK